MPEPDAFPTPAERAAAQKLLRDSHKELREYCLGLQPADWTAMDGPGRWSPAGILEHLLLVEKRVNNLVQRALGEPAPPDWRESTAGKDALLPAAEQVKEPRKAPEAAQPTFSRPPTDLLQEYAIVRRANIELLDRNDLPLKQHVAPHGAFGPLSTFQWLLLAAHHTRRHIHQMEKIKAARNVVPRS